MNQKQTHNAQLQRTVMRHRVRPAGAALPLCACGAVDTFSRGRLIADPDHSDDEDRFILVGLSIRLRLLVVHH